MTEQLTHTHTHTNIHVIKGMHKNYAHIYSKQKVMRIINSLFRIVLHLMERVNKV